LPQKAFNKNNPKIVLLVAYNFVLLEPGSLKSSKQWTNLGVITAAAALSELSGTVCSNMFVPFDLVQQ
jgi:hypothetical protein